MVCFKLDQSIGSYKNFCYISKRITFALELLLKIVVLLSTNKIERTKLYGIFPEKRCYITLFSYLTAIIQCLCLWRWMVCLLGKHSRKNY